VLSLHTKIHGRIENCVISVVPFVHDECDSGAQGQMCCVLTRKDLLTQYKIKTINSMQECMYFLFENNVFQFFLKDS
jgi:hypothetical protein